MSRQQAIEKILKEASKSPKLRDNMILLKEELRRMQDHDVFALAMTCEEQIVTLEVLP